MRRKQIDWIVSAMVIVVVVALSATPARGVVVFIKGNNTPIMGFLVRQDNYRVVIEQVAPDGQRRAREFLRIDLDDVIITVSPERLASLSPDDPRAYRAYAEELAEKRQDPEARETAIRLFLLAAALDPEHLGRSSLLGMIDLARNRDEETRFRAAAYLLDPDHDARLLKRPDEVKAAPVALSDESRTRLLSGVRLLRQGMKDSARRELQREDVRKQIEAYRELFSYDELIEAFGRDPISGELLRKLLVLELSLDAKSGRTDELPVTTEDTSWQQAIRQHGLAKVPSLSLAYITEFNPQECLFRDGKWVAMPEK